MSQVWYIGVLAGGIKPKFEGDIGFELASICWYQEGLAMPYHFVSRALLVPAYPPGPSGFLRRSSRVVHPVPYTTICTTLRHVNRSHPRTTKVGPKVTCLWNTITSLWTSVSIP